MARPPRQLNPGTWHHVMHRGADRQDIVVDDDDRLYFEALLADMVRRSSVSIHAYVLMSNHLHLLIQVGGADTSTALQRLFGASASRFNQRHERTGPLFSGRFRSVEVLTDEQLVTVGRYIHRNPLDMVPIGSLAAFRWSSYPVYLGRRSCTWLSTGQLRRWHEPSAMQRFVETPLTSDSTPPAGLPVRSHLRVDDIVGAVASVVGVATTTVCRGRRGADNTARTIAAQLVVELRVAAPIEAAQQLGFSGTSGLRTAARRGRIATTSDPSYRARREQVLERLGTIRPGVDGV